MRFYQFPKWLKRFYPNAIWDFFLDDSQPNIYLTFDDGPTPMVTEWVLDILAQYNAKATFFCVGNNVKKYPKLFNRYIDEGHSVGNHTMNHISGISTNTKVYINEVIEASQYIHSNLFRPPYGKCTPKQYKQLFSLGYQTIFWSHLYYDFDSNLTSNERLYQLKANVKPGSIIVFHDSQKAFPQLKKELPLVLEFYQSKGYDFKPIVNLNK